MTTEIKHRVSIAGKAQVLRDNGIQVKQWLEPNEPPFFPMPILYFVGDEYEGKKAVEIAQANGFPVFTLAREWNYGGYDDPQSVSWSMII